MSTPQKHSRDRGNLFHNADKRKPSQPDMRGDGRIDGAGYDMQAWRRDDVLALALAPTRDGSNTYPPDAFRGELATSKARNEDDLAWVGEIVGDEQTYTVRAFSKQGKSGPYLALYFEATEPGAG